ncbi:MAG TPA: hypothetical protein VNY52_05915 [Solirubrobacteraceae bacterium]|jgi:hypothetical protein|nr:hypothetical protein [Solirubrobacteraceae bacterium]
MPPINLEGRAPAAAALTILLLAAGGLAACGSSSSNTTNVAATASSGTATSGTSSSGTATNGTSSSGTATNGTATSGTAHSGTTTNGTSSAGTAARQGSPAQTARLAAVRTCLSKKGVTLPQRSPGAGGLAGISGAQLPKGMTRAQFAEALRNCGTNFSGTPGGKSGPRSSNPFNNPRFHRVLAQFSACLRQHGVNVGEPNTSGKGPIFNTTGINTGSPQFKAAEAKCRSTLLGALRTTKGPRGGATG